MSALTPALAGRVKALSQWVSVAGMAATVNGALMLFGAVFGTFGQTMIAPQHRATIVASGTFNTAMALVGLFTGFMLRRYSQKLALAAQIRHSTPIVDGSAYEMGYWRLTAPAMVVWLFIAALGIAGFLWLDLPALTSVPEHVNARLATIADTANLVGIALGIVGLLLIALALRPPTR